MRPESRRTAATRPAPSGRNPVPDSSLHLYHRERETEGRSSLTVISHLVAPGSTVLDVGRGTRALGSLLWLTIRRAITAPIYSAATSTTL